MSKRPSTRPETTAPAPQPAPPAEPALLQALDVLPDGLFLLDRDGRIVYANRAARTIGRLPHGPLQGPLQGPTLWQLFPPTSAQTPGEAQAETIERLCREALETRAERSLEDFHCAPSGLRLHIRILPADTGLTVCCRDITDRKRTEAALIQSEKLAAVGRMASSIAHEINNPLEAVTNLLFLARQYAILPEVQRFLDLADQELRRVATIANQTLRFHRQATGPCEVTATELFLSVLGLYEARLRSSRIVVQQLHRTRRAVTCLEGDIRQVLNNLVGNAIDAMHASPQSAQPGNGTVPTSGRLLLRSREATDWRALRTNGTPRRGLVLTIADTGVGIAPADRARIFEAFFTTKGLSGSGLGLWISASILERHQGRLLVRSRQHPTHHGAVFSLFLPFDALPI